MFSFLCTCQSFPYPKAKEATVSKCVLSGRKGQKRHSDGRAKYRLIFHRALWIGSVRASQAWCSRLPCISDCKHKWLQKPERPSIRLYSKKYFFAREKQWRRCTDKWHLNLPSGSRRNPAVAGVRQQKGCAHLHESSARQRPAAALT